MKQIKNTSWIFASIIPNLCLTKSIETKYAALVHTQDKRIVIIRNNKKVIDKLLANFSNEENKNTTPPILIIHKKISSLRERHSAIISFRNIIAVSSIMQEWIVLNSTRKKYSDDGFTPFADYYDLFPIAYYTDDSYFIRTPAKTLYVSGIQLPFQPNFLLSKSNNFTLPFEDEVQNSLIKIWQALYLDKKKIHSHIAIFRSLQMAMSASRMPFDNMSTIYDYGTKIGLWISAFEILFHSGTQSVGLEQIVKELNTYNFSNRRLNQAKFIIKYHKKDIANSNIISRIYEDLYRKRNSFLHGNNIENIDLFLFSQKKFPKLLNLAPVVYFVALRVFLKRHKILTDSAPTNTDERTVKYLKQDFLEKIFINIIRKKI